MSDNKNKPKNLLESINEFQKTKGGQGNTPPPEAERPKPPPAPPSTTQKKDN